MRFVPDRVTRGELDTHAEETDEEWASRFVRFGSIWLLPDSLTGVITREGRSGLHPWVVVGEYRAPMPIVSCALGTTQRHGRTSISIPAGSVYSLPERTHIVPRMRRPLRVAWLRAYRDQSKGQLAEPFLEQLRQALMQLEGGR